jgi:hypothetical protein
MSSSGAPPAAAATSSAPTDVTASGSRRPAGAAVSSAKPRSQTAAADAKKSQEPRWLVKIPPYLHEKLKSGAEQASAQQTPLELGFVTVTKREDGERDVRVSVNFLNIQNHLFHLQTIARNHSSTKKVVIFCSICFSTN